jgi:hypothetical protein
METQFLINCVIGIAAFFGGWILNSMSKSIVRLEDKVADLPHIYVQKDDYRRDIDDIKGMLKQIFNKLDNKADK